MPLRNVSLFFFPKLFNGFSRWNSSFVAAYSFMVGPLIGNANWHGFLILKCAVKDEAEALIQKKTGHRIRQVKL